MARSGQNIHGYVTCDSDHDRDAKVSQLELLDAFVVIRSSRSKEGECKGRGVIAYSTGLVTNQVPCSGGCLTIWATGVSVESSMVMCKQNTGADLVLPQTFSSKDTFIMGSLAALSGRTDSVT